MFPFDEKIHSTVIRNKKLSFSSDMLGFALITNFADKKFEKASPSLNIEFDESNTKLKIGTNQTTFIHSFYGKDIHNSKVF